MHYLSRKNDKFAAFKEQQQCLRESMGLGLEAYLMLPVQRLPRYKLLIEVYKLLSRIQ